MSAFHTFALTSHMYSVNSYNVCFSSHLSRLPTLPVPFIHCPRLGWRFFFCKTPFSYDSFCWSLHYFELSPQEFLSAPIFLGTCVYSVLFLRHSILTYAVSFLHSHICCKLFHFACRDFVFPLFEYLVVAIHFGDSSFSMALHREFLETFFFSLFFCNRDVCS